MIDDRLRTAETILRGWVVALAVLFGTFGLAELAVGNIHDAAISAQAVAAFLGTWLAYRVFCHLVDRWREWAIERLNANDGED